MCINIYTECLVNIAFHIFHAQYLFIRLRIIIKIRKYIKLCVVSSHSIYSIFGYLLADSVFKYHIVSFVLLLLFTILFVQRFFFRFFFLMREISMARFLAASGVVV